MAGPEKSDGAFRTIREVADWLGVPTHVLRFWESKFDQIAPVKGAGGRRYYRPEDMRLLGGIKVMLHDQGLPIRGVIQKIDDEGADAVMSLSPDLDMPDTAAAPKTRRVIRQGEDIAKPVPVPRDAGETTAPDRRDPSGDTTPTSEPEAEPAPEPEPDTRTGIAPLPEPEEPEPGQPGDATSSGQLGDETDSPQPSDEPVEEPQDGSGQPDVPCTGRDLSRAPVTDPEPDTEPDIAPEPDPEHEPEPAPEPEPGTDTEPAEYADPAIPAPAVSDPDEVDPAAPDLPPSGPEAPAGDEAVRAIFVPAGNQRRLRRIIRKLRGLIEEVEGELREEAQDAAEPGSEA